MYRSHWEVVCECGKLLVTRYTKLMCPYCKRQLRIEWQAELPEKDEQPPRLLSDSTDLDKGGSDAARPNTER